MPAPGASNGPVPQPPGPHPRSESYRRYLSAVILHAHSGAQACGLGATDLYALNLLRLRGSMTAGELARHTGLSTGAATRLADRLERAGYLRRRSADDDRRKVIVEPVASPAALDEVLAPVRERIAAIVTGYTDDQQAVLFDYFARAAAAYQDATSELRGATEGT